MRILLVSQYYYPESFPSTLIAEELVRRGHQVDVLTGKPNYGFEHPPKEYDSINQEERHGVHIYRVKLHKRKNGVFSLIRNYLSFWRNSKRFLKKCRNQYDLVYGFNFSPIMSLDGAGRFAKKRRLPFVIHVFDLWPESVLAAGMTKKNSLFYKFLYRLSKKIYDRANLFLLSSPGFKGYFTNVLKIDKPTILTYQPISEDERDFSNPFKEEEKPLVYCGNIGKVQNLTPFISAFSLLPKDSPYSFYVIGEGSEKEKMLSLVRSLSLENKVFFLGRLSPEEALHYRRHAYMNVVSLEKGNDYVSKTIPTKLLASLEDARPILASVGEDGAKMLEEAGGSFLVDPIKESVLSALEKASSLSENELRLMGERNKKYYDEHLSSKHVMDVIEDALKEETNRAKKQPSY